MKTKQEGTSPVFQETWHINVLEPGLNQKDVFQSYLDKDLEEITFLESSSGANSEEIALFAVIDIFGSSFEEIFKALPEKPLTPQDHVVKFCSKYKEFSLLRTSKVIFFCPRPGGEIFIILVEPGSTGLSAKKRLLKDKPHYPEVFRVIVEK